MAARLWADTVPMPVRQNQPHPFSQRHTCHRVVPHQRDTLESKKVHGGVSEFLTDRVVARDLVDYGFDFFITPLL